VTRVLVVDDEPIARRGLRALLSGYPAIEVVGECRTGREARGAIAGLVPDLVFLDIMMPDLDGFGALEGLDEAAGPAVVFVTAYEDQARRAFDVHAVDYLLKPFDRARFDLALNRALERIEATRRTRTRTLVVRDGRGTTVIDLAAVSHAEARGNYVRLHAGGIRVLHREPLGAFAARLAAQGFRRVSRSTVVNLALVKRSVRLGNGRFLLVLADGTRVSTSRRFRTVLEGALGGRN
jgi:two-component system, LytTR family, response regulator